MGLIQLRHVPEDVHRTLKARAAMRGLSLSDYVLAEVVKFAQSPPVEEITARIAERGPSGVTTEQILAARDAGRRG